MKYSSLILILLSGIGTGFAQTSASPEQIIDFQSKHPNILFMSAENFYTLSESMQNKIAQQVLVFDAEITVELLESHSPATEKSNVDEQLEVTDDDRVKEWVSQNPDVKVLSRKYYDRLDDLSKEMYANERALITAGETLTYEDILHY